MENKKIFVGLLLTSLLLLGVVPYSLTSAQSCNPDALKPVSYGQRGTAVKNAQACLMEAGYNIPAGATGYYGAQTRAAVRAFYADWYGSWSGNSLGPKGVAQLKDLIAGGVPPQEEVVTLPESTTPEQQQPGTSGVPQDVLMQVLAKISAGDTAGALALLAPYMGSQLPPATTTQATTTQQTQQQPTEGFLNVEQDPTVTGVTLREGETGKVFGLRFRADNGPVTVQSVFLRWNNSTAPYRVISKLEVVDDQNNVLFSRNVDSTTFLQDSALNYYLPVTGLNYQVQTNQYRSLFVQVTVVGTLPTGVTGSQNLFSVGQNEVRGRDGVGIDRFGPGSTIGPVAVNLQAAISGTAYFVVSKNVNSPLSKYVLGDSVNGNAYKVPVLVLDVAAKNDNLRLTQVLASVTGTANVTSVYLSRDAAGTQVLDVKPASTSVNFNTVPANFTINKDQTVQLYVLADFVAPANTTATFTVSVATTTGLNSLGEQKSTGVNVSSDVMYASRVAPEVAVLSGTGLRLVGIKDSSQNIATTTIREATFVLRVTARGGTVYIPTSALNPTSSMVVSIEKPDNSVVATGTAVVVNVNPTNAPTSGNYYVVTEGSSIEFTFQKDFNANVSGNLTLRAKIKEFKWDRDGSGDASETDTFYYTQQPYWTSLVTPQ
ncbi:MAG: hypothetical protein KatS3mg093_193 [Candidatus Parcubacteria bacterium]|nr:MAG: hypothetical protein KatS3mg093_193 [Candidatus Parcubacteria bacterium]